MAFTDLQEGILGEFAERQALGQRDYFATEYSVVIPNGSESQKELNRENMRRWRAEHPWDALAARLRQDAQRREDAAVKARRNELARARYAAKKLHGQGAEGQG
jgi:hypothetical protein